MNPKTCVFIIGTNCSGKTTVAKRMIEKLGGQKGFRDKITYTAGGVAFAGKYDVKFGGVDYLNSTSVLPGLVARAFESVGTIVCEGVRLKSYGDNMTKSMYLADRRYVFYLHASLRELEKRLKARTGNESAKLSIHTKKQILECYSSMRKWNANGCHTAVVDTEKMNADDIASLILKLIGK